MIVTPVSHGLDEFLGKSTGHRSEGCHASQIYNDLFSDLEPDRFSRDSSPDPLKLEFGLALESMLEEGLRQRIVGSAERPPEQVTDEGIYFSPDLIVFNGATRLGEIKLTWMSSREMPTAQANGLPPKFEKWVVQMKFYCRALALADARLLAFFVNGDYGKNRGPQLRAWDISFTRRELDDNYRMLLAHARRKGMLK